jgi:hypothetical protein
MLLLFKIIVVAVILFCLVCTAMFFWVMSKDPFDVFSEEDNYKPPVQQPFTNECAGRNYWV